jgi:glycosyltransferase involved in cell wall biosynthesis
VTSTPLPDNAVRDVHHRGLHASRAAALTLSRPRVMHVVLSLDPGGTERLVIDLVTRLQRQVDAAVCCLDRPGAWAREVQALGVPLAALGRRPGFVPTLGPAIARAASAHSIQVLHCHHYSPFVYGQLAALCDSGLRVVFTEHGRLTNSPPSRKRRLANRFFGRRPDAICAVSEDLRRHLIAEGMPQDQVAVVHNGIDPGIPPTSEDRHAMRAALGISLASDVIGWVGRLDGVKDVGSLISSIRLLDRAHPPVTLLIVGDGPERARLEAQVASLGLTASVVFAGYRSDVRRVLAACDIYANSSLYEGVSITILEAMAASLPVVATRVGGTPEVVIDGATGYLVTQGSPHRMASALAALIGQPERRRAFGEAGRNRVIRTFSLRAMSRRYLDIYQQLAAAR